MVWQEMPVCAPSYLWQINYLFRLAPVGPHDNHVGRGSGGRERRNRAGTPGAQHGLDKVIACEMWWLPKLLQ